MCSCDKDWLDALTSEDEDCVSLEGLERVYLPSGRSTVCVGGAPQQELSVLISHSVKTPLEERGILIPDWNYSSGPRAFTAASEEGGSQLN